MAAFTFVNNSNEDINIDIIICPNPWECKDDKIIGDGRYDNIDIPAKDEKNIKTDCDEICWRCSYKKTWTRTKNNIIIVSNFC